MRRRIGQSPLPGEDTFHEETKAFLAVLRSIPEVPEEDDPNGWFLQICDHLKRTPIERMERWAWFADGELSYSNERHGVPHVRFDPVRVLRTLTEQGVAFVVVGMGAGYLQGAPYPSYNIDITPGSDPDNVDRMGRVLGLLKARPLEWDGWRPVAERSLPGFRRLTTSAGMVNVVDAPWGLGDYDQVLVNADRLEVAEGLLVWVASLEDVIRSKEAMRDMPGRSRSSLTMDGLHVLMGKETLMLRKKYASKWNLSIA
jgi:hypothetical protein